MLKWARGTGVKHGSKEVMMRTALISKLLRGQSYSNTIVSSVRFAICVPCWELVIRLIMMWRPVGRAKKQWIRILWPLLSWCENTFPVLGGVSLMGRGDLCRAPSFSRSSECSGSVGTTMQSKAARETCHEISNHERAGMACFSGRDL